MASNGTDGLSRRERALIVGSYALVAVGTAIAIAFAVLDQVGFRALWEPLFSRTKLMGVLAPISDTLRVLAILGGAYFQRKGRTSILGAFLIIIAPSMLIEACSFAVQPAPNWFRFGVSLAFFGLSLSFLVKEQREFREKRAARLVAAVTADAR